MITMEAEGITWVGDVFHKFEAMCLEVEEVVCEDTVKYVENQVQTVGASVKKFYCDVMQDLLPPSCVECVIVPTADSSLNQYADSNMIAIKVDKQVATDSNRIAGSNADQALSFSKLHNVFPTPSSVGTIKGARSELCLPHSEDRGSNGNSVVAMKTKSNRSNHLSSTMLRSFTPGSKDLIRVSLCNEICDNHEVGDQIAISCPASVEDIGGDSSEGEKFSNNAVRSTVPVADASVDFQTSDMNVSVEPFVMREIELRSTYSIDGPCGFSPESNGTCTDSGGIFPKLYAGGDTQFNKSTNEDDCSSHAGRSGDCNLDLIDNSGTVDSGMDTIEQFQNSKLEETCVFVDGDKLCLTSNREDKPRSYKKKIRKAFSSKSSARKHEYEQLAVQYGDMNTGSNHNGVESMAPILTGDANTKELPTTNDFCESEWELL